MGKLQQFLMGPKAEPTASQPGVSRANFQTLQDILLNQALQQDGAGKSTLQVPAVYRGVQILADGCAQFPWFAWEGGRYSGSRMVKLPVRKDIIPTLLIQPDPLVSRDDWVRAAVMSLVMRGNCYLLGSQYVEGHPQRVQVLNPDQVSVSWADQARTIRKYKWGEDTELPTSRVRHLTLNLLSSSLKGLGPIPAISRTIKGQIEADNWARSLFSSSGTPSGKLIHPGKLDFEDAQALALQWDSAHVGTRQTAVLSGGMDFMPISLTPDQAQFLQSRSFGVAEIARALGIPSYLLNAPTGVAGASGSASATYSNVQQIYQELLQLTLLPTYLNRMAEAMSSYTPRGTSVQFDVSAYMQPDESTRFANAAIALDSGFLTVDEVRQRESLPPSPELAEDKAARRAISEQISGGNQSDQQTTEPESAATASQ